MAPRVRWLTLGYVAVFFASLAPAGESAATPQRLPLAGANMAPALLAAAERDHVKLHGFDGPTSAASVGDAVVLWVGTKRGDHVEQWLLRLERGVAASQELAAHRGPDRTKYVSWGSVVVFHSEVEPLDLWIAGPVNVTPGAAPTDGAEVPIRRTRVFVPREYLRLGLDDSQRVTALIGARIQALKTSEPKFSPGYIYALDKPVKPEKIALAKPTGSRLGLTPEMERAWLGGYVALQSFYDLVNGVGELHDIANVAVEKPSVLKLVKLATGTPFMTSFGGTQSKVIEPGKLGMVPVSTETFEVGYSFAFDHDPIVGGAMAVTSPTPPLDVCAGIIGLIAVHPHDPTRVVQIAVVSAERGTPH